MAYTGHLAYKATGELTYRHPIREQDLAVCKQSLNDWRADGFKLTDDAEEEAKYERLFQIWLAQNQKLKDVTTKYASVSDLVGATTHTGEACAGIYLKATGACIGYALSLISETTCLQRGVALLEAERGKGYYSDARYVGLKMLFQTFDFEDVTWSSPRDSRVTTATQTGTTISMSRVDPVEYKRQRLTQSQWNTWINLDAQESIRNQHYSYEINWSEE